MRYYATGNRKTNIPPSDIPGSFGYDGRYPSSYVPRPQRLSVPSGTPIAGVEKNAMCGVVQVLDRNDENRVKIIQSNWIVSMLSEHLGRDMRDIRRALRDPDLCDGMQPSVVREVAQAEEEVFVEEEPLTLLVDSNNAPILRTEDPILNKVWNNCIRSYTTMRPDGKIYNCRRFYTKTSKWGGHKWEHPEIGIAFGWNYRTKRLYLPFYYKDFVIVKKEEEFVLDEEGEQS